MGANLQLVHDATSGLAVSINTMHDRARASAKDALESARLCGQLLLEAKAGLGHGEWQTWMVENITFSERTAQRYMKLASCWEKLKDKNDTVSYLSLNDAMTAIRPAQDRVQDDDDLPPAQAEAEADAEEVAVAVKAKRPPRISRTQRWTDAARRAIEAVEELAAIQEEFQSWRDNLPENLSASALAEKLEAVAEIDLQSALEALNEAEGADLPLGFGRD